MEKKENSTRIFVFQVDERRFGLFETDIARIKRYSDKALASLGAVGDGEEYGIRSFRAYLSMPEDIYAAKPLLIRPHSGKDLLTVDSLCKKRRVKTYDIFPTRFDYIKEVLIDNERIPVFNLPDLLRIDPPLEREALESVKNGVESSPDQYEHSASETGEEVRGNGDEANGGASLQEEERSDSGKGEQRAASSRGGGFSYFLLAVALASLFATGFFIFGSEYVDDVMAKVLPNMNNTDISRPVTSYLSHQTRLLAQQTVFEVLQKKKGELEAVENALTDLESEKNSFLRNMEERHNLFDENVSVFYIDDSQRGLETIVDFVRNKVEFKGEAQRREDQFLAAYEQRRESLTQIKKDYEQQMADLTAFHQGIEAGLDQVQPFYTEAMYIDEAKSNRIRRLLFLLERGDHNGALRTLESVAALPFRDEERASQVLLNQLLLMLQEYGERMKLIEDNAPFNDIKLSYLNEDYGKALHNVRKLEEEDFIKPLLTGLKGALYTNMEMKRQLEEDIALRKQIRELVKKAALLEKEGEYVKAIDTYESLLIFPLPTYDKEFMLEKVHSLWLEVELRRVKREENTKAIKYLESARILNREGNEKEAIEYYRMLLTECPHSDFVSDAIDEIMNLANM